MMFLLVSKFKMIGMLLNVVNGQVQKSKQNHITKESNAFHNHSTLITMCRDHKMSSAGHKIPTFLFHP